MNIWIWLIPTLLGLVLAGTIGWIFWKRHKKKKLEKSKEYEEVLKDFQVAEELYSQALKGGSENGETINPYEILWEIAKSKRRNFAEEDSRVGTGKQLPALPSLPQRRSDVSGYSSETDPNYESEPDSNQRRNRKSIFGRRARR